MALPGNPRGRTIRCTSPRHEAGRRRNIGVVAVPQSTPARPRRWCDAGPPEASQKAGAEGTGSHTFHTSRRVPLSLGYAIPTAARLMVGPAPPYGQAYRPATLSRRGDLIAVARDCPLDNVRHHVPPNRFSPRCQTLIKDGTSGRGQSREPSRSVLPVQGPTNPSTPPCALTRRISRAASSISSPTRHTIYG